MSRRAFRIALIVVLGSLVLAGGAALYVINRALGYPDGQRAGAGVEVPVSIERGLTFPQIAAVLHREGVIDDPRWFRFYAMHRGVTTRVRSGDYVLRDDMTPREVIDRLLEGVPDVTVEVTIPEGLHILEVFDLLEEAGVARRAELEKLARDPDFLERHGITGDTAEGYLFPETYRFRAPTDPGAVLERMIRHHREVWGRLRQKNQKQLERLQKQLGWSERDILIMASIVQKEAAVGEERPRIAQVFINRLTSPTFRPKRLETDPTIRYGCQVPLEKSAACQRWDLGRLRRLQLDDRDNPYNTYQHEGLPPGPICSPGEAALDATLNPDGSNFFFFVARRPCTPGEKRPCSDDRRHVFSRTLAEHERAVDKYQR